MHNVHDRPHTEILQAKFCFRRQGTRRPLTPYTKLNYTARFSADLARADPFPQGGTVNQINGGGSPPVRA